MVNIKSLKNNPLVYNRNAVSGRAGQPRFQANLRRPNRDMGEDDIKRKYKSNIKNRHRRDKYQKEKPELKPRNTFRGIRSKDAIENRRKTRVLRET